MHIQLSVAILIHLLHSESSSAFVYARTGLQEVISDRGISLGAARALPSANPAKPALQNISRLTFNIQITCQLPFDRQCVSWCYDEVRSNQFQFCQIYNPSKHYSDRLTRTRTTRFLTVDTVTKYRTQLLVIGESKYYLNCTAVTFPFCLHCVRSSALLSKCSRSTCKKQTRGSNSDKIYDVAFGVLLIEVNLAVAGQSLIFSTMLHPPPISLQQQYIQYMALEMFPYPD